MNNSFSKGEITAQKPEVQSKYVYAVRQQTKWFDEETTWDDIEPSVVAYIATQELAEKYLKEYVDHISYGSKVTEVSSDEITLECESHITRYFVTRIALITSEEDF